MPPMGRAALSMTLSAAGRSRATARRDTTMTMIETDIRRMPHVLLATDLGEASGRATQQAIALAARDHAVLQILAVATSHADRGDIEQRVGVVRSLARASGVRATSMIWHGDPAEAIVEAAWTERPDVLVVGARRRRWLARLLGSVSGAVAAVAPCRVEVVAG
jgi:nucleotide-binding universal stress UspA family protein